MEDSRDYGGESCLIKEEMPESCLIKEQMLESCLIKEEMPQSCLKEVMLEDCVLFDDVKHTQYDVLSWEENEYSAESIKIGPEEEGSSTSLTEMKSYGKKASSVDATPQIKQSAANLRTSERKSKSIPAYRQNIKQAFGNPITPNCGSRSKGSRATFAADEEDPSLPTKCPQSSLSLAYKKIPLKPKTSYPKDFTSMGYERVPVEKSDGATIEYKKVPLKQKKSTSYSEILTSMRYEKIPTKKSNLMSYAYEMVPFKPKPWRDDLASMGYERVPVQKSDGTSVEYKKVPLKKKRSSMYHEIMSMGYVKVPIKPKKSTSFEIFESMGYEKVPMTKGKSDYCSGISVAHEEVPVKTEKELDN